MSFMSRLAERLVLLLVTSIPFWVGDAVPAATCEYHGRGAAFESPRAAEVVAAMRDPANIDVLQGRSAFAKRSGLVPFYRAVQKIQTLRETLEKAAHEQRPDSSSFSLLLVEGGLWSRYVLSDGWVKVEVDTEGPRVAETTVTTGEAVIAAIASGRLSPSEAYERNLIVVDGAPGAKGDVAAWLRDALAVLREGQQSAPLPSLVTGRRSPSSQGDTPARE
jgi:hypothetical protein